MLPLYLQLRAYYKYCFLNVKIVIFSNIIRTRNMTRPFATNHKLILSATRRVNSSAPRRVINKCDIWKAEVLQEVLPGCQSQS